LIELFEGNTLSACLENSIQVLRFIWWGHNNKAGQYSSIEMHGSLKENADNSH